MACLAGRKDKWSINHRGEGFIALGCGSKTLDRRPVAAGVSPVGLSRIITSTLERLDTLMAGGAIQQSTIQLQNAEEELLRPELTARSLARL